MHGMAWHGGPLIRRIHRPTTTFSTYMARSKQSKRALKKRKRETENEAIRKTWAASRCLASLPCLALLALPNTQYAEYPILQ